MERKLIDTGDNSKTLLIPDWKESYHSTHGALTEARHVFIENGLAAVDSKEIRIFEMGFGTGLNALVSLDFATEKDILLHYDSIEKFPLTLEEVHPLNYPEAIGKSSLSDHFESMHFANWGNENQISSNFLLRKIEGDIQQIGLEDSVYDIIYYDAFGPRVQAELWSEAICMKLFSALKDDGIIVTYCAQGQFKRNLKAAGFEIESLAGPPGKREMTRARKAT